MEIPEDPGSTVRSALTDSCPSCRSSPNRKPARLDFTDGPPARKSPMPVDSRKKTKNPHPS